MPSRFDDDSDFLDEPDTLYYATWSCTLCHKDFVDPDDYPDAHLADNERLEKHGIYWLSPVEVVCSSCAISAGIPSVDEEENGR